MPAPKPLKAPADGFTSCYPHDFFDALLVVSFGGPEGMDDVMPFLENVTRGRNVPRERLREVAHHYERFGGVSPINAQNRALIGALRRELDARCIGLPIYFGNRNWHPMLPETVQRMTDDGVKRALAFFTSGFSCYSGCRQYREDIHRAQQAVGPAAPEVLKTRMFYNHPGFVRANAERVREALGQLPAARRGDAVVVFTAHSIPLAQARHARYQAQLRESARLVAQRAGVENHRLAYQSRSGPPHVPWLEPDVCDLLRELDEQGVGEVALSPLGFVSDHMEVLFDLDVEAREAAEALGMTLVRAESVGTHPEFVRAVCELIEERLNPALARRAWGAHGPSHAVCPADCCLPGTGEPSPWAV